MAKKKISELPPVVAINRTELHEVVQGGVNKSATTDQILAAATQSDVGLDQVDNTSDANKPVSTAQSAAIAQAQSDANDYTDTAISTEVTNRNNAIAAALEGLKWKASAVVATTANITLSGEQTIDGVLTSASRVLVKDQTAQEQNGIYISGAAAWSRSSDADTALELESAALTIEQGTANANTTFTQITDNVTLGTSNIVWTQLGTSVPLATPSTAGIAKLYDSSAGNNTDGAMDQAAAKAYIDTKLDKNITTNRQTASYTLVLSDATKLVEMNVASANNLTVPLNSSVAFSTGTQILISQYGAGQTTVVATGGVTIRSAGGKLKLNDQHSGASLTKIATDEWYLFGDITT
jgi:predicted membrane-bound mannosyltransferase